MVTPRLTRRRHVALRHHHHQRGAALLVALLIAALVAVTVTMMLQRQSALAGIEWQMRETAQARRILLGAEDWAQQILRQDARRSAIDHLGEPWRIPLKEGRLADFLKSTPEAAAFTDVDQSRVQDVWLSGQIVDADARYNLMRLSLAGAALAQERALWLRVAAQAGLPLELAQAVARRYIAPPPPASPAQNKDEAVLPQPQPPLSLAHLAAQVPALAPWIERLSAWVVVLPDTTTVNVNTAPKPVLMALIRGLDDKQAERLMDLRLKAPFRDINSVSAAFPEQSLIVDATQAGVTSRYFVVYARVRLGTQDTAESRGTTEVALTTTIERIAQDVRTRVVRREFGPAG